MINIEPTGKRLLLRIRNEDILKEANEEFVISADKDSAEILIGGILLCDNSKRDRDLHAERVASQVAEVFKISDSLEADEVNAKVGDIVMFERYEGIPIEGRIFGEPGVTYRILDNHRVCGKIVK